MKSKPYETIQISEFKATCLAILRRVQTTGRPVIITKRGVPIAQISPPQDTSPKRGIIGAFADRGRIVGDVITPLGDELWEAFNT